MAIWKINKPVGRKVFLWPFLSLHELVDKVSSYIKVA